MGRLLAFLSVNTVCCLMNTVRIVLFLKYIWPGKMMNDPLFANLSNTVFSLFFLQLHCNISTFPLTNTTYTHTHTHTHTQVTNGTFKSLSVLFVLTPGLYLCPICVVWEPCLLSLIPAKLGSPWQH